MTPGTTASLICPACGQAFLSMQQSMEGMVQCPHCAHNALRGRFGTQAQVAGVAQVRRRVSQTPPLQSMPALAQQPPQPEAWPGVPPQPVQAPTTLMARPTLQYSQALMPTGAPPPQPEEFTTSPYMRTTSWRGAFILLSFTVVCGGAFWLWWDSVNESAAKPGVVTPPPSHQASGEDRADRRSSTDCPCRDTGPGCGGSCCGRESFGLGIARR